LTGKDGLTPQAHTIFGYVGLNSLCPHMYTSNSHVPPDPRMMVISGYLSILPVVLYTPGSEKRFFCSGCGYSRRTGMYSMLAVQVVTK